MTSLFSGIDYGSGSVTHLEEGILQNGSIEQLLDRLSEDLLQVHYNNGFVLDVGWYGEGIADGCFKVVAVQDGDWDKPLLEYRTQSLEELEQITREAAQRIEGLLQSREVGR
jgi:hypothetical protein